MNFFLSILLITLISACASPNLTQPQVTPSSSLAETGEVMNLITIPDNASLKVVEVVDVEAQFIAAYQAGELTSMMEKDLDIADIKVKFQSWSPDGEQMLLRVRTGEILEGRFKNAPVGILKSRISISDLWLADNNGVPIAFLAQNIAFPVWSPDAKSIAYIHRTLQDNTFNNELWILDIADNNNRQMFSDARSIDWLDNRTIIFINPDNEKLQLIDITTQEMDEIEGLDLAQNKSQILSFVLSPDRHQIALQFRSEPDITIATIEKNQLRNTTIVETSDLNRVYWSPDSHFLILSPLCSGSQLADKPSCHQINVLKPDGTLITQIDNSNVPVTELTWLFDNQYIILEKLNTLYLVDIETTYSEAIYTFDNQSLAEVSNLKWQPNGWYIGLNQDAVSRATILEIILEPKPLN